MKIKRILPVVLVLVLAACSGAGSSPTPIPTIVLGSGSPAASTQAASTSSGGSVTASGVVVADQEARMAFGLPGNVKLISVRIGDQVQTGQTLVQLDESTQQIQLNQANLALQELTSPSALAAAQQALAQAQVDLYNFQNALNNLVTQHANQSLIDNTHAGLVLATNALKDAQTTYDAVPGDPTRDSDKAAAYQKLYAAQQVYNHELYLYNVYSGQTNQSQLDEATAQVALANARVAEGQTLVAALGGTNLPEHPSGAGYAALMQAKFNLQSAQTGLDATHLVAPFSGEIAVLNVSSGDYVTPGQVVLVITDVTHMHVETTDLSERDIPNVKLGQAVTVNVKALNQAVPGKVSAISPLASTLGGDVVYKVSILLNTLPSGVLSGMSVSVQFNTGQ